MGGPELGNPGFGFGYSMSYIKNINHKYSTSELFIKYNDICHNLKEWHTVLLLETLSIYITILLSYPN